MLLARSNARHFYGPWPGGRNRDEVPSLFDNSRCLDLLSRVVEQLSIISMCEVVHVAVDKVAEVVKALRFYLKEKGSEDVGEIDMEKDIDAVITLIHGKITYGVKVVSDYGGVRAWGSSQEPPPGLDEPH